MKMMILSCWLSVIIRIIIIMVIIIIMSVVQRGASARETKYSASARFISLGSCCCEAFFPFLLQLLTLIKIVMMMMIKIRIMVIIAKMVKATIVMMMIVMIMMVMTIRMVIISDDAGDTLIERPRLPSSARSSLTSLKQI